MLFLVPLAGCALFPGGEPRGATVYRDRNGVPHIVGDTEEDVWYALGHENARDALFVAQKNLRLWSGHAAEFLSNGDDKPSHANAYFRNDFICAVFQTDLARRYGTEDLDAHLIEMLGDEQLFRNLRAYARGLDAYRSRIEANRNLTDRERRMRAWLDANEDAWIYTEPIRVEHVAAWGPYIRGFAAFFQTQADDPTPGASVRTLFDEPVGVDGTAASHADLRGIELVKAGLAGQPGSGSNSFAWSFRLTDPTEHHTGHLADPQGPLLALFAKPETAVPDDVRLEPKFFAHMVVRSKDALDVFGYMFSGAGLFFSFHNRDFAVGGSASKANLADSFLLRLRTEDESTGTGEPIVDPERGTYSYYSYHADTDGDDGADEEDWIPLEVRTVWIRDGNGVAHDFDFLDAGRFGIVPFPQPFPVRAERSWNVDREGNGIGKAGAEHVRAAGDRAGTIPCVVAYRIPGLPGVDDIGWDSTVPYEERPRQPFNDRFAAGEYRLLRAKSARDLQREALRLDATYTVNACAADREGRIFVSRLAAVPRRGDDAAIAELGIDPAAKLYVYDKLDRLKEPVPARWYADRAWDWQFDGDLLEFLVPEGDGGAGEPGYLSYLLHDPVADEYHPAREENPGFATASNDETYHAADTRPDRRENALFVKAWDAATLYASTSLAPEPLAKTAFFVDAMTEVAEGVVPPLREADARALALSNRSFVHRDYPGYETEAGYVLDPPNASELATIVRVLAEMAHDRATLDALRDASRREERFVRDLAGALGVDAPRMDGEGLDDEQAEAVVALVADLVAWGADAFANVVDSRPALLVEELRLALEAAGLKPWFKDRFATLMADAGTQGIAGIPLPPFDELYASDGTILAELDHEALYPFLVPGLRTRNRLRVMILRLLLDADAYVREAFPAGAGYGDLVRARLFALDGGRYGPESGFPCVGSGLRLLSRGPDPGEPAHPRGFRRRLWALGGSTNPILTIFPHNRPDEPPRSYFWNVPGQRPADFESAHALEMMRAFAANRLVPTFFSDYDDPRNFSTDPGLPASPYSVP